MKKYFVKCALMVMLLSSQSVYAKLDAEISDSSKATLSSLVIELETGEIITFDDNGDAQLVESESDIEGAYQLAGSAGNAVWIYTRNSPRVPSPAPAKETDLD